MSNDSRRRAVALVAAGLTLLALPLPAPAQPAGSVVVVPFANLSRQPADDWIGAGLAETIAADLRNAGLRVVGHRASDDLDPRPDGNGNGNGNGDGNGNGWSAPGDRLDIQRRRGVTWLVDGTLQRLGDRLRITTRVINVATGATAFGTRVDGAFGDLFAIQDEVGAALAARLLNGAVAAPRPGPASAATGPAAASDGPGPTAGTRPAVTGALAFGDSAAGESQTAPARRRPPRPGGGGRGGGFIPTPAERPTVTIGRTSNPPQIDGRLDDSVWETATHVSDFIQIAPIEGAPGTEETEVWMAYDNDHLYFAFYAHYSRPEGMRINRADREEIRGDDRMSVLFDPFTDQQRAYQFEVNGYGVQADSLVNADGSTGFSRSSGSSSASRGSGPRRGGGSGMSQSGQFGIRGDDSWNALFDTGGQVVADGWTAEMRIPFKSLRYPSRAGAEEHRWGFQITRVIRDKSEAQSWSPISRGVAGQLTQFGVLEGLSNLSRSRNLEFLPELTGFRLGSLDRNSGAFDRGDPRGEMGVGVKYGITPNLTADITFNPDFSQIESDRPQIETNQRFALFYPEQRPFFLEGQEIFQTATPLTLVHTRTIIDPRFGGKLTGKVGNSTLGVVVADDQAAGFLDDTTHPQYGATAQTVLGRARYDFYAESYLGAIATAREFGTDYNRVAGVDGRFRLGRTHRVSFLAAGSETQDEALGSLAGNALEADFSKQGRNLSYNVAYSSIDPEFHTGTGFLPRVDLQQTSGTVSYRWWPESNLMTWGPSVTYLRLYDHGGVLQDEQLQGMASFSFRNNMAITGMVNRDLERYGQIDFRKTGYGFFGVMSARILSIYGGYNWGDGILYADDPYLGRSTIGNVNFRFQPTSRLRTEFNMVSSDFVNPLDGAGIFHVKIFRTRTTYQFTDRLLARHIAEHNTQSVTVGNNILITYRINAGTVLFLGYDDRYQQGNRIDSLLFPFTSLQRTNRAFFGKLSYLFRY
jgi:TolB-like protein